MGGQANGQASSDGERGPLLAWAEIYLIAQVTKKQITANIFLTKIDIQKSTVDYNTTNYSSESQIEVNWFAGRCDLLRYFFLQSSYFLGLTNMC